VKALVIGYGSIGRRHVRLLNDSSATVAVVSRRQVDAKIVFSTIAEAAVLFSPDYVVVASRTNEHRDDLMALAVAGYKGVTLIEKPLFNDDAGAIEEYKGAIVVAYNLRFHPVVQHLKNLLKRNRPYAVHAYVGQHLPDWRPETDYRTSYSANRAEGGGALRDLSHELDYLNWSLGGWTRLTALGGHLSDLKIDSDDVYSVLFETARCPVVSVQMNYLDSTLRREVLALTDRGSIHADLVSGTVTFDGQTKTFSVERDETYVAEHRAAMAGETDTLCSLAEGLAVNRMIAAAGRRRQRDVGSRRETDCGDLRARRQQRRQGEKLEDALR